MILLSRHNEQRYLNKLSDSLFEIYGESEFIRLHGLEEIQAIDYEGGPFINVGQVLLNDYDIFRIERVKSDKPNHYYLHVRKVKND